MAMDEHEESQKAEAENAQQGSGAAPQNETEEERGARVDAAKAFFRAMYAGEEPPSNFGTPAEAGKQEAATSTVCRKCEAAEYALKEAEAKTAEAETLYKRMAADFENYRRRMEREREESVSIGVRKAAEGIMPALDDLDRAMLYLNIDTPPEKLLESVKLVGSRFLAALDQIGVKPIQSIGQPFDPKFHEPVQQIETTEFADGVVMSELRRGYMLNDKVVRPALVNVASNSSGVVQPGNDAAPAEDLELTARHVNEPEATASAAVEPEQSDNASEAEQNSLIDNDGSKIFDLGDVPDA